MNQPVPKWCMGKSSTPIDILTLATALSNQSSLVPNQALLDYAKELTCRNGIVKIQSSVGRIPNLPVTNQPWDRIESSGGTLESIVDQATRIASLRSNTQRDILDGAGNEFVKQFGERHQSLPATVPLGLTMEAAVPSNHNLGNVPREMNSDCVPNMDCMLRCNPPYVQSMGSCSASSVVDSPFPLFNVGTTGDQNLSGSAASWMRDTQQLTLDAPNKELLCLEYHSPSLGLPEKTNFPKRYTKDEHDSPCHSRNERNWAEEENGKAIGKSSVTQRRGRTAASHNQSERKRRDRINQKLKTLQKLVPNSSKTDKASMLEEVIEYLQLMQAQFNIIKVNFPWMMLPLALQQPLPMSIMNLGMNIGMGMKMNMMDLSSMGNNNITRMSSVVRPSTFMPPTSLNGLGDVDSLGIAAATTALPSSTGVDPLSVVDPLTAFIQSQPMNMDAFAQMAALCPQFQTRMSEP